MTRPNRSSNPESRQRKLPPFYQYTPRPVSNDMARSALFSCIQGKDRRFIKDALLATVDGVEIRFTGEQLNQDDHDLLMQLIFMARATALGKWVTVSAYAILNNGPPKS